MKFLKKTRILLNNSKLRVWYHDIKYGISRGCIFMLHRVDDKDSSKLDANENMKISPAFLDAFLTKYEKEYSFIRLQEVPKYLKEKSQKKFMCFTMDDGYADKLSKALPVFRKHNTPFIVFLSTDFADRKAVLWWYTLEDIILSNDQIVLSNNRVFECKTKEQKERTFLEIREIILGLNSQNLISELNELFGREIDWMTKVDELAVSWKDIRRESSNYLLTIGGHTVSHCNLKEIKELDLVKYEIQEGLNRIKKKTGMFTNVFAYPYGSNNGVN